MLQTTTDLFYDRRSVKQYNPDYKLTQEQLIELLDKANRAPSAWNLQHWKFLVLHSEEARQKLLPLAFHQQQIVDAAATVVLLADREAYHNIEPIFSQDVKEGRMTEEIKSLLTKQVNGAYSNPEYGFEAAVLNASLAGMQLMNAATAAGLGTCPIGGFNRTALIETFNIEARYLPILLITIGEIAKEPRETSRRSVEDSAVFL